MEKIINNRADPPETQILELTKNVKSLCLLYLQR